MPELLVILVIVVLLFGTRKLPELGKGVGSAIKNFKSAMRESEREEIEPPRRTEQITEGTEPASTTSSSRTTYGNQA